MLGGFIIKPQKCFRFTLNKVKVAITNYLNYISSILITKREIQCVKVSFTIQGISHIYPLLYSLFTLCIVPLFYFNLYILAAVTGSSLYNISLNILLISGFLLFYIFSLICYRI